MISVSVLFLRSIVRSIVYMLSGIAFIVYSGDERIVSSVHVVNVLSELLV